MKKFYLSKRFYGLLLMFIGGGLSAVGMIEIGTAIGGLGLALASYGSVVADKKLSL